MDASFLSSFNIHPDLFRCRGLLAELAGDCMKGINNEVPPNKALQPDKNAGYAVIFTTERGR